MNKSTITAPNPQLIAYCGLYCGTCAKYKKGKCPGCQKNDKASWCKIRTCNIDHSFTNCAECYDLPMADCKKLNNTIGKLFGLIFKTDRLASLRYIKDKGEQAYATKMVDLDQMAIKKGQKI